LDNVGMELARPEARRPVDGGGPVLAALDLGTNNCRLLVARPRGEGFRVVDAFSRIVRLGEGLAATGALSAAAMDRTVDALKVCAAKMRRQRVTHARAVATEACRQAENCAEFLARVRAETGIEIEIIPNQEEAALAFAGCAPLLHEAPARALLFDIGGGSTEVGCLELAPDGSHRPGVHRPGVHRPGAHHLSAHHLSDWRSIPIGVVNLAERHGADRISAEGYESMVRETMAGLDGFGLAGALATAAAAGELQMLGTSGTITTLCGVHLDLPRYDRAQVDGAYLDFATIERISGRLAAMSWEERAAIPCIGRERADLVVAGCAILAAICRLFPVGRLRVADRGVREGILFGLLAQAAGPVAGPSAP
jgi:exopolyphosphatase / guanosine-5'-triphosphate,3'-diphosphate pyrophosphatase